MTTTSMSAGRPWYKEAWPWALMAGPAAAVVMGIVMVVLAVRSNDGLVVDDYYKRGLAINQTLERSAHAQALALAGTVTFSPERDRVRLVLTGNGPLPDAATLRLVHPTRAGQDQTIAVSGRQGVLDGTVAPPGPGRWHLQVEDNAGTWRITGEWPSTATGARLGN